MMKLNKISSFSAYARVEAHLTQQTFHGAVVTVCGVVLATILFLYEIGHFWNLHSVTKMSVDLERRHDLMISVGLSFPAMPCAALSIDVLDVSGTSENDASFAKGIDLHKIRLDKQGKRIGKAEYHTPQSQQIVDTGGGEAMMNINVPQATRHLIEMEEEADRGEGCHVGGTVHVKRVAGRLHISVHQQIVFQLLPQLLGGHHIPRLLNMSHVIDHLSFGPHYPGQVNPLDGFRRIVMGEFDSYKYFLKVVPTEYYSRTGRITETHQYSVSEYTAPLPKDGSRQPSLDFTYDMSPIIVTINEKPPSFLHFLVRISAVVGGAFAVTRMTDRWVHFLISSLQKMLA